MGKNDLLQITAENKESQTVCLLFVCSATFCECMLLLSYVFTVWGLFTYQFVFLTFAVDIPFLLWEIILELKNGTMLTTTFAFLWPILFTEISWTIMGFKAGISNHIY